MAENGILDYQGMNQAIYRGATSNIVVDTQSMSIEIGAGNSSHTSNLHFECNHDANVASIKLNSNVVTEFSRSKKLIKYPRVALTSDSDQSYIVTRSSQFLDYNAWEAFDENNPVGGNTGNGSGWASTIPGNYSVSTGAWGGGGTPHHTGSTQGEWIQIQLPDSIYLHDFVIESRSETTYGADGYDHGYPKDVVLYGSINGSSWDTIKTFTTGQKTFSEAHTENVNETRAYKYFALVVNSTQVVNNTTQVTWTSIGQIRLFGVPEYDPEAHGTDVIVKSVPNVPNTDWLEVYYDAKSYSTLPDSVNDESGSTNTFNGTIPSGHQITFDDGDIKAFVFPGRDSTTPLQYPDYIQTTLSGWSDNQPHTQSCWFKPASITSFDQVFGLWDVASTNYEYSAFGIHTDKFEYYHFGSEFQYPYDVSSLIGTWCHISAIHTGYIPDTKVYLNGHLLSGSRTQGSDNTLSLGTAPKLALGKDPGRGNASQEWAFHGSIANYRLFNRALTSDEIYQLYAYQKEYFGHGDLSMTLKAGRLGIGTSEPRAALDVRGEIRAIGSMFYLLDTPIQNEWYWSGSTSTTGAEVKVIYSQLPDNCRAVYADVFLPQASANDHGSHTLGRDHKRIGALWTAGRSSTTDNQPTVYMGDGLSQGSNVVFISQPGQNDTEYYFGNWWPSLTIPLAPGNVLYHGRNGFGGTGGWILVYVKGYYI